MLSADDLTRILGGAPGGVRGPRTELQWITPYDAPDDPLVRERGGHLVVTLRLITYDSDGQRINNIKEQECALVEARHRATTDAARAAAYLAAWRDALAEVFHCGQADRLDAWMPHDLVCSDVLKLKTAHTFEDFRPKMRARGRLGKLLTE